MTYNSEFVDNVEFLIMCRNLISHNHKYGGCLVRQQGFITATLETYLDFWFNCLPVSTDKQCRPICAVSKEGCYVRNDNHELIKGELNVPVEEVVRTFLECKKRNKAGHDSPSLGDVVCLLHAAIGDNSVDRHDLVGWMQYFMPAKISVLEIENKTLRSENNDLRASLVDSEEKSLVELSRYSEIFRDREEIFNSHIESCDSNIEGYKDLLFRLKAGLISNLDCEPDRSILVKMAKDAIRYYKQCKQRMIKTIYRDVPTRLTDFPISTINRICGTKLDN